MTTNALDEFLAAYDKDSNEWWRRDAGDQLNLFDALREDRDGWRDQVVTIRAQQREALKRAESAEAANVRDNDSMNSAYLAGYEFALRNLRDEAVQADLHKLTAGVNDDGAISDPPHGADDALDESKGAVPSNAPAPTGLADMIEHFSSEARLALEKSGPRIASIFPATATTDGETAVSPKPPMVMRSIRVPRKLWDAARTKADEREESISDVVREALERYVRRR